MLGWLASSRPDLCVEISQIASIMKDKFNENSKKYIKRLKTIEYAHSYPTQLRYPKLNVATMRIVGYSYVAFANNDDLSSQLGRAIFLANNDENAAPIAFNSYKSRRVTRSVLTAEVIAFAYLFDEVFCC